MLEHVYMSLQHRQNSTFFVKNKKNIFRKNTPKQGVLGLSESVKKVVDFLAKKSTTFGKLSKTREKLSIFRQLVVDFLIEKKTTKKSTTFSKSCRIHVRKLSKVVDFFIIIFLIKKSTTFEKHVTKLSIFWR